MLTKYKVLETFTFRGVKRSPGEVIELTESKLEKLKAQNLGSKVEVLGAPSKVADEKPAAPAPAQEPAPAPASAPAAAPEGAGEAGAKVGDQV